MATNKRSNRTDMGGNVDSNESGNESGIGQDAPPHSVNEGGDRDSMRVGQSQVDMVLQRATRALEQRINQLHVPREAMQIGESVVGALLTAQEPLRRTMKKQPGLTIAGVVAMCTGGLLLGLAIVRSGTVKSVSKVVEPKHVDN